MDIMLSKVFLNRLTCQLESRKLLHGSLNGRIICITVLGFLNLKKIKPVSFSRIFWSWKRKPTPFFFLDFVMVFGFPVPKNMHTFLYGNVKKKEISGNNKQNESYVAKLVPDILNSVQYRKAGPWSLKDIYHESCVAKRVSDIVNRKVGPRSLKWVRDRKVGPGSLKRVRDR